MRREGSPWTGLGVVLSKETADHLSGAVVIIVIGVLAVLLAGLTFFAAQKIRDTIGQSPFLFLRLLTLRADLVPLSFVGLLGIVLPLIAIALGFDAVNGEFNRRTLSRVLAQPIYRDALLLGKFLARLLALSIGLLSVWLLVIGLGLIRLGVPPNTEETIRMFGFLAATIAYGGVWLALAFLFSTLFRAPATAALAALGCWLLFALFWSVLTPMVATLIAGPSQDIFGPSLHYIRTEQVLQRLSPNTLYGEIALALLHPSTRALGPVFLSQLQGALLGEPLPVAQSFVLVWPQLTGLVAAVILLFAAAYVAFQRQEIRA